MKINQNLQFRSAEILKSKKGVEFYKLHFEDLNGIPVEIMANKENFDKSYKVQRGKNYNVVAGNNSLLFLGSLGEING